MFSKIVNLCWMYLQKALKSNFSLFWSTYNALFLTTSCSPLLWNPLIGKFKYCERKLFIWNKAIRLMVNLCPRVSCRKSIVDFKSCLFIVFYYSNCVYCIYVNEIIHIFHSHKTINDYNTRFRHNILLPAVRLTKYITSIVSTI